MNLLECNTKEEYKLCIKALKYEQLYFKDMILEKYKRNCAKEYIVCESGEKIKTENLWFEQLQYELSIEKWNIKVVSKYEFDWEGQCEYLTKTISIAKNDRQTLLHEMIHAYEFVLSEHEYFKQLVLIDLTNNIYKRIRGINKAVAENVHIGNIIHSPLFMLKSIDLDLKLGLDIGTIYSYGKTEDFKGLKKTKK